MIVALAIVIGSFIIGIFFCIDVLLDHRCHHDWKEIDRKEDAYTIRETDVLGESKVETGHTRIIVLKCERCGKIKKIEL